MKNRFVIIVIAAVAVIGLFVLARSVKRGAASSPPANPQEASTSLGNESSLKEARAAREQGSLLEAKELYQRLMETSLPSQQLNAIQDEMESLNIQILFSGVAIEGSQIYEVKPGDALVKIAKQFNTTVDAISKANNIKSGVIHPGMKLRVLTGVFSIFVDKSQNILMLKYNNEVVKIYAVSTGKNNSTPVGTYKVVSKLINPVWYKDGKAIPPTSPENILGSRWLGFDLPTYGIHGTVSPQDIGKQITEGCVRMRNEDVEELYSLVPAGVEVVIVD